MTNEEAIDILYWCDLDLAKLIEARDKAIEALEKQIPKNPVQVEQRGLAIFCPNCKRKVVLEENFCTCGQKIDWCFDYETPFNEWD